MTTLFDPVQRQRQLNRLKNLHPDTRPAWGKLTAGDLLPHLSDPMRTALGEIEVVPEKSFSNTALGRWLAIYGMPRWPKGSRTNPKYDVLKEGRRGTDFAKDMTDLIDVIERFAAMSEKMTFKAHGSLGRMSNKSWGHVMHKHLDHHFRQFGI